MPRGKRQPLSARIDALRKEVQTEFARLKRDRDAIDKEMGLLSEQFERLTGRPLMDGEVSTAVVRQGKRGPKVGAKKRGRRGAKSAKLAQLGGKLFGALNKDKGTKYTTARALTILGDGAQVGPAVKAWNKGNPDKQIHASGPGRAREYVVK